MNYDNYIKKIIKEAVDNKFIDNEQLYKFFSDTHAETSFYKATGLIEKLRNEIMNQIENNLEHRDFLMTFINSEQTTRVFEYIIIKLQ